MRVIGGVVNRGKKALRGPEGAPERPDHDNESRIPRVLDLAEWRQNRQ